MARSTPKSAPRPAPAQLDPYRLYAQTPADEDFASAIAEAQTLVSLLTGFEVGPTETEHAAALRSRGWPLFEIDGETALPSSVRTGDPRLQRELARLLHVAKSVISAAVLQAHETERLRRRAQRAADFLQLRAAELLQQLDAADLALGELRELDTRSRAAARALTVTEEA